MLIRFNEQLVQVTTTDEVLAMVSDEYFRLQIGLRPLKFFGESCTFFKCPKNVLNVLDKNPKKIGCIFHRNPRRSFGIYFIESIFTVQALVVNDEFRVFAKIDFLGTSWRVPEHASSSRFHSRAVRHHREHDPDHSARSTWW